MLEVATEECTIKSAPFSPTLKPDGSCQGVSGHAKLFTPPFPALPMPSPTPPLQTALRRNPYATMSTMASALAKYSPVFLVVDRQSNIVRSSGG